MRHKKIYWGPSPIINGILDPHSLIQVSDIYTGLIPLTTLSKATIHRDNIGIWFECNSLGRINPKNGTKTRQTILEYRFAIPNNSFQILVRVHVMYNKAKDQRIVDATVFDECFTYKRKFNQPQTSW